MIKRLAWIVIIAAAAAGGCLTGSGAIRGETPDASEKPERTFYDISGHVPAVPVPGSPQTR